MGPAAGRVGPGDAVTWKPPVDHEAELSARLDRLEDTFRSVDLAVSELHGRMGVPRARDGGWTAEEEMLWTNRGMVLALLLGAGLGWLLG
jgi:hypothetical protein